MEWWLDDPEPPKAFRPFKLVLVIETRVELDGLHALFRTVMDSRITKAGDIATTLSMAKEGR